MTKRDDILGAAERLFYLGGFHATGIDRIVAEAGVTPRTLYRHFRSKEELVRAVLQRREARFLALLEEALDREVADETERWTGLFARMERWFHDEGTAGCMFLKALGEYGSRDDAIAQQVIGYKQRVLDGFRERIAASRITDTAGLAEGLVLLLEGAIAQAPVVGGRAAGQQAASAAIRLFRPVAPESIEREGPAQ